MTTLFSIMMVVHVLVSIGICALVLLQRGKGADAGAAFGAGASGTVFGARGAANFLSRATAVLATVFFVNSLALAYLTTQTRSPESIIDAVESNESAGEQAEAATDVLDPDAVPTLDDGVEAAIEEAGDNAAGEIEEMADEAVEAAGEAVDAVEETIDDATGN